MSVTFDGKLEQKTHILTHPSKTDFAKGKSGRHGRLRTSIRLLIAIAMSSLVLAAALAAGGLPRLRQQQELNAARVQSASTAQKVTVALASPVASDPDRVLPGNSLPLIEASLFARTTGYLKRQLVDIGDAVTEGQLLAEISAPDIDDQLAQARANLEQARAALKFAEANAVLATTTLARVENANKGVPGTITKQEIDQDRATVATTAATVETAKANIVSNEATVQRYVDLQAFQKIVAPFSGVITARNIDTGDLVTADNPSTKELFHVMQTDILRVFVNVPQVYVQGVTVGQDAVAYRRENPDRYFAGKVTRTADALDPQTRTLLTEIQVPNPDNVLRPGMYLQVKLDFHHEVAPVVIPAAALATRNGKPRVAVLDDQSRVQYRTVRLGRDYGAEIAVLGGLNVGEMIVIHPGDDLPEGIVVDPIVPSGTVAK